MFIEVESCIGIKMMLSINSIMYISEATQSDKNIYTNCNSIIQLIGTEDALAVIDFYEDLQDLIQNVGGYVYGI